MLVDSDKSGSPVTQRDSSSLYSNKSDPKQRRGRCSCVGVRCLCVAILLLTIVSCTALIITLLTASGVINFRDSSGTYHQHGCLASVSKLLAGNQSVYYLLACNFSSIKERSCALSVMAVCISVVAHYAIATKSIERIGST